MRTRRIPLAVVAGLTGCVSVPQSTVCNPGFVPFAFGNDSTWQLAVGPRGCTGEFSTSGTIQSSSIVKQPANGTAFIQFARYGYSPRAGFSGTDQFTMSVSGQSGARSGTSMVTVRVQVGK
jgi:hypothetical protein